MNAIQAPTTCILSRPFGSTSRKALNAFLPSLHVASHGARTEARCGVFPGVKTYSATSSQAQSVSNPLRLDARLHEYIQSSIPFSHVRLTTSQLGLSGQTRSISHNIKAGEHRCLIPRPHIRCFASRPGKDRSEKNVSASSKSELEAIFGEKIEKEEGVQILLKLQHRRRQGLLDQELDYPQRLVEKGLSYLRERYPLDEDAAIVARLDREIDGVWSLPQQDPTRSRTGKSGLREIRKMNLERRKAEEAAAAEQEKRKKEKKAAERLQAERDGAKPLVSRKDQLPAVEDNRVEIDGQKMPQWVAKYYDGAIQKNLPRMTLTQRLLPSTMFLVAAIGLSLLFAQVYTPPSPQARIFREISMANAAVGTLIFINLVVFFLWRVPPMWKFMNKYFALVPAIPKPFQLLGAEFSHQEVLHLVANMAGLWLVGCHLHDDIGRGRFLALVVCGAMIPSYCSLVAWTLNGVFTSASVGASGMICALIATSCILYEGMTITLPYLPPRSTEWINPAVVLAVLISIDIIGQLRSGLHSKHPKLEKHSDLIDRLSHLAGHATGITAGIAIRNNDPYWGSRQRDSFWTFNKGNGPRRRKADERPLLSNTSSSPTGRIAEPVPRK